MAGGEDICTLAKLYGEETQFIRIDISPVALELARRTTLAAGVKADFIEGNATQINKLYTLSKL
jgi:ubiquinone/menaquinone biosynthesis C-methylase UbiE